MNVGKIVRWPVAALLLVGPCATSPSTARADEGSSTPRYRLAPGQELTYRSVTKAEPKGGEGVYKVDWKGVESLDTARSEINNTLRAERLRKMVQSLEQPFTTEINEGYFATDGSSESN